MKKDLLIIGAYPSTDKSSELIYRTISQLNNHFDVALTTHCPADKNIQQIVKYYIYDHRNEMVPDDPTIYTWADYPTFFCKLFATGNKKSHHSYAVFLLIINAIKMLGDYYDSFYYVEGDCLFSDEDVLKLKSFKDICKQNEKEAMFFTFGGNFLSALAFFCKTEFFKKAFPFLNSSEEYTNHCQNIQSFGIIENFFYQNLYTKNMINDVYTINGNITGIDEYFPTSKIGLTSMINGETVFDIPYNSDYLINVARIENTQELAMIYLNENNNFNPDKFVPEIYMDGQLLTTVQGGKCAIAIPIFPKNNGFTITHGNKVCKFKKELILDPSNESIVILK